ncbi:MAG TPA: flavohemoglobin expression-modulating QEGLA motif protein [Faecalibacter sp.]
MKILTIQQIIKNIENEVVFEAYAEDESFKIKIDEYIPYVCAAIHDGGHMRDDILEKCSLSNYERWYEEDPHTAEFVGSFPILIQGCDSRFEYDLNRDPETAIYEEAWGKQVWETPLSESQKQRSLAKHQAFYEVIEALIQKLESKFEKCVVYDIHSYNWKRWDRPVPVFNIGAEKIDPDKFGNYVEAWREELSQIELGDIPNFTAVNDVFYGRGYLLGFITKHFENTLVLATEVSKIYCDELTGESFPEVINQIKEGFKTAIVNHAFEFIKNETSYKVSKQVNILHNELESDLLKIDKQLYHLVKDFELLSVINPINLEFEKKKFLASNYKYEPQFKYNPLNINPFEFKRKLSNIKVEKINDISIQNMYVDTINSYFDKVDLLANLGTNKFLYNSLRYFGEPSKKDVENANFVLYCPEFRMEKEGEFNELEVVELFRNSTKDYGFDFDIEISDHIASKALVINSKKKVVIKRGVKFDRRFTKGLIEHEIGVHMVTTMNAVKQPLKIFSIGLPVNTLTQEGLAILSEYYSDSINHDRLRELGLRVLAVNMLTSGKTFNETFLTLHEEYKMAPENAFYLTTRVFRGGGFTKDALYLKGLKTILNYVDEGKKLDNLLIGKTSVEYVNTINELVERKMINPPKYYTKIFKQHQEKPEINPILKYIFDGLKD